MKHITYIALAVVLLLGLAGCKGKKAEEEHVQELELNEQTVTEFARQIATGIVNGHAEQLNNAFDAEHIRQLVSENSIVYSGFDVEGGEEYFEKCLHIGEQAVHAINEGGDFAFIKYYVKDNEHHVVFRTYNDFNLNFMDFVVDTVKGALKIKDGFVYNTGHLMSKNIEYSMLYNLMLQTNPNDEAHWLQEAQDATLANQSAKALKLLDEHKEGLKEYPLFYQLYIANLYKTAPQQFIAKINGLNTEVDERYLLLHKLFYYFNEGKTLETENTVNALIPYTGDDPIYLLFYAKACLYAKDYERGLTCLKSAEEAMPLLWDLWYTELQCYKGLKDETGFDQCLQRGKDAYGMSDGELEEVRRAASR